MKIKIKNIILIIIISAFTVAAYFGVIAYRQTKWSAITKQAQAASAGFPQQFGLSNTIAMQCMPVEPTGNCLNHPLCALKPNYECAQYTVITGTPAGGDGSEVILNAAQLAAIQYKTGDSIIAGGLSSALLQVVAAPGGCYGCH